MPQLHRADELWPRGRDKSWRLSGRFVEPRPCDYWAMDVSPQVVMQRSSEDREGSLLFRGLVIGFGLCIAFMSVPVSWVVLRELVLYPLGELGSVTAVLIGVYRYRPQAPRAWRFIGAGLFLFLIADVIWGTYRALGLDPFPSAADVFYLAAYPLFAAGLAIATFRRRHYGVDIRAPIDTAIVTVSCAYIAWAYIITPVLNDGTLSTLERTVTILYPVADLVLLAAAARFVIGSSWNIRSLRVLAIGFAFLFVGDVVFALNSAGIQNEQIWDTALLIGIVLIGVAALDPSMRALTEEVGDPATRSDKVRRLLIGCGLLVPPVIIVTQLFRGVPLHFPTNGLTILFLTALAALRFHVMATAMERAVSREAILSRYTADLLGAGEREQLFQAAGRALTMLARKAHGQVRLVLDMEGGAPSQAAFSAPVTLRGERIATVVADADPATLRRWRESLTTIATQLSIALEWDSLLEAERETAESLSAQNARLRELDAMKDRFVSAVTHELRTPLTSMVGYLELLREGEAGELNADQAQMVGVIERSCHRLNELIDEILVTAQLDSGSVKYTFAPVDIARLASKQVEAIAPVADKQGVRVQLIVESQPPALHADEMRLGQVIDNLLSNAVKFTPVGGTITVTVAQHGDAASLKVSDTGVGMPANELDKVFDRFYRTTTATTTAGTGLGLWIAQQIAKAHGGLITVTSELNVGTTFDLHVPLHAVARSTTSQQHEVRT